MFNPEKFSDAVQQFSKLLPVDVQQARSDIEKNLKAAMSATLAKMDLVTREEFDVQVALLAKTRALVDELENKLSQLEVKLNSGK